jgi:arylsulfatase A-like enzyme
LLTGRTVPGHGVYRLYDNLPDDQVLFTERLQQAGYTTALFGKLHVSGRLYENERRHPHDGFDVYEWSLEPSLHMDSAFNGYARWLKERDPEFHDRLARERRDLLHVPRGLHMTHWAAERTIDVIRESQPEQPFFVLMSVFDPHNPYEGYPLEAADAVDPGKIRAPLAETAEGEPEAIERERNGSYLGRYEEFTPEELRKMRFDYLANVAFVDQEVGRVLDALEEKGIAEDTLVIFTSDHGDMLGDHRLFVKGAFFYDAGIRVPLILRWPGRLPEGRRVSALVQLQDLAATVMAAAGVPDDEWRTPFSDSHDLLPLARGECARVRDYAVTVYRNTGIFRTGTYPDPEIHATMLRDERYKLNVYLDIEDPGSLDGQLFDMREDPRELVDLWESPDHAGVRERLLRALVAWETRQELLLGSRGGDMFPAPKQRLDNRLKKN